MIRAGIFIGVDKTGNLQTLHDAAAGAERMHGWAIAQGMADKTHARLITDAGGQKVDPGQIYDAIKALIDGPGVDQLILYFAGHGVNIARNEYWLLTDAPVRTSAAVNVSGSVELARYCGIGHVVIISDACRVAPDGIQAQNVRGEDVFPNDGAADRAKPVDQFFACFLGRTAAEIKDPAQAAADYRALYTGTLLDALGGLRADLLEPADAADDQARYVRARRLQSYLEDEVPRRVKAMGLLGKVNQSPDAIITSATGWLARIDQPPSDSGGPQLESVRPYRPPPPPAPAAPDVRSVTRDLVRSAAAGRPAEVGELLQAAGADASPRLRELATTAGQLAVAFGPDHFETRCGIKLRGTSIAELYAPGADASVLDDGRQLVRVESLEGPAASCLLRFPDGSGTLIPVVADFIAAVTWEDGEIVDVAYEPSANTWRWDLYRQHAAEVRTLRGIAAAASRSGRFRLEGDDRVEVARKMQYAKGIDPTLAVYAAYAYFELQETDRIREMSHYMDGDIGVVFFDLALLGRMLVDRSIVRGDRIVPFVPLLSQGWALLRANRVRLHPALEGIDETMRDSLWTLVDPRGADMLEKAMRTGDVR